MRGAAIFESVGQFVSGNGDSSTTELVLIWVAVTGGGIIWEAWRDGHLWSWPTACVFVGVIIEAAATIFLFEFDERIISSQNGQIIALETRLLPRTLSETQIKLITEKMKPLAGEGQQFFGMVSLGSDDAWDLWSEISFALEQAGWKPMPPFEPVARPPVGRWATMATASMPGITIWYEDWDEIKPKADALAKALRDENIVAGSGLMADMKKAMLIEIGPNPHDPPSPDVETPFQRRNRILGRPPAPPPAIPKDNSPPK
jgi:hypothetical protein